MMMCIGGPLAGKTFAEPSYEHVFRVPMTIRLPEEWTDPTEVDPVDLITYCTYEKTSFRGSTGNGVFWSVDYWKADNITEHEALLNLFAAYMNVKHP